MPIPPPGVDLKLHAILGLLIVDVIRRNKQAAIFRRVTPNCIASGWYYRWVAPYATLPGVHGDYVLFGRYGARLGAILSLHRLARLCGLT